jgi:hypothetical protein
MLPTQELHPAKGHDADSQVVKFLIDAKYSDIEEEGSGEDEDFEDNVQFKHAHSLEELELEEDVPRRFKMHRINRINKYIGFQIGKENIHNTEDFNWEEHVYSILLKFVPDYAEAQNQQMTYAFEMTKGCFGNTEVDTSLFRSAIENYLMYIYGVKDDAVNYGTINKVLQYQHKVYIRRIMTEPHKLTQDDFAALTKLTPEERAHISVLVMETKRKVELLYLTKVLSLCL